MDKLTLKTHEVAIKRLQKLRAKWFQIFDARLKKMTLDGAQKVREYDVAIANLERLITPEPEAPETEVEVEPGDMRSPIT